MRRQLKTLLLAIALPLAVPAFAQAAEPLVMTYVQSNADYWDLDVARQKGFFAQEGFDPQYVTNSGSVQSTQLLLTGAVQLAVTQPEALIAAIAHGAKSLGAIAAPMRRVDWMLVGRKDIKSLSQLKGKTLGFSGLRVTEYWLTQKMLKDSGLPPGSYDAIQVGITPAKYAALSKGSIAATILFEPTASQAVHAGFTHLSSLGKYDGYVPGVYVVNADWASKNNNGVRLARALGEAHAWLYDPGNRVAAISILKHYSKAADAAVNDTYDEYFVNQKWYTKKGEVEEKAIKQAIATLRDHGELTSADAPHLDEILLPAKVGGLHR